MRIRFTANLMGDRAEELGVAANVRQEILAHAPVEIDPTNPVHGIHRDIRGRACFEFSTALKTAVSIAFVTELFQTSFAFIIER